MTQSDAEAMEEHSKFLWNSEIWRVTVNVQHRFEDGYEPSDMDSLRLDLRQPLPNPVGRINHRQIGSIWLDVASCGLRLERATEVVVACGDPSEKVLARFRELVGRALVSVDISPPGGDTNFVLDDGLLLRCFPASGRGGESWRMSSADDDELLMGPGARWSYRSGLR